MCCNIVTIVLVFMVLLLLMLRDLGFSSDLCSWYFEDLILLVGGTVFECFVLCV